MRFLTVLSAFIMAIAGAFCFAFYMNGYAGVAFVLGLALLLYGLCHVITYAIGFRKSIVPESAFVEGFISVALGLLVLAGFVSEGNISVYFGFWFFMSGLSRFTESLAVSKINPHNWFAVLPLSMINILFGFVMTIPSLLVDYEDIYLIAITFILQAFSVAIYSLYMVKIDTGKKAQEAKERAEAKKKIAEAKRAERDRIRQLSESEREAEIEAARQAKLKEAEEKAEERKAKKEVLRPVSERTISFTPAETAQIIVAAEKITSDDANDADMTLAGAEKKKEQSEKAAAEKAAAALEEKLKADEIAKKEAHIHSIFKSVPGFVHEEEEKPEKANDAVPEGSAELKTESKEVSSRSIEDTPIEELNARPVFNKPTNIPTFEKSAVKEQKKEDTSFTEKRGIVNLDEIENKVPDLNLAKIELPELQLKSEGGEADKREAFLLELEDAKAERETEEVLGGFTPLTLEELFSDEQFSIKPLTDKKATETDLKLTQTFTFDWLDSKR